MPSPPSHLTVVCLCAAWCGVCTEYRSVFDAAALARPTASFLWIDIEDEADRLGTYDVDTFPTLVLSAGGQMLFAGPLPPQAVVLERLVAGAEAGELVPPAEPHPALGAFVTTLVSPARDG